MSYFVVVKVTNMGKGKENSCNELAKTSEEKSINNELNTKLLTEIKKNIY
jgi:hypothetical protein